MIGARTERYWIAADCSRKTHC